MRLNTLYMYMYLGERTKIKMKGTNISKKNVPFALRSEGFYVL